MQIKNIIVSLIAISLLPVCCERLRNDSRLDENVDSTCDADSSLTECEMLSDTTAFVGNGNTLLCRLPSIIKEAKVQGRNLNILEKNINGNTISVNVDAKDTFSELSIECSDAKEKQATGNYYLYKKDGMTYVSSVSMDSAIEKAGDDPLAVNSPVVQSLPDITNPNTPIPYKGTLKWMDDNGNYYPLVGVKISAQVKTTSSISPIIKPLPEIKSVYTNSNGYFDLGLNSNTAVANTFNLYLSGQFVSVYHVDNNDQTTIGFDGRTKIYKLNLDNYCAYFSFDLPLTISSKTKNDFGSDFGQATQIFEAVHYYSRFAKRKISANDLKICKVNFPCQYDYSKKENGEFKEFTTAFYRYSSQTIFLPTLDHKNQTSPLNVYQSWDTIGHEYGHHIGNLTGFCAPVGGSHYSMKDDVRTIAGLNKAPTQSDVNNGLALAWSESWPTYWSQIAQCSFPEDLKNTYGFLADEDYNSFNFSKYSNYSIAHNENFASKEKTGNLCGGDANERGIMRFLYEINRSIGGYQKDVHVKIDNIWDLLKESIEWYKTYYPDNKPTFSSFYEHLYSEVLSMGKYKKLTLNKFFDITSYYWFSPIKVKASKVSTGIHLKWIQGGDYFKEATDNYCYLEYLDENGSYLQYREIKPKCIGRGSDHMYWFEADVNEPLLDNGQLTNVKTILLNYSPRVYKGKFSFSSSYPRVIWSGEDFTVDKFASIDLDKELITFNAK